MYHNELRALGIEVPGHVRNRNFKTKCPKCGDTHKQKNRKDLSVNVVNGVFKCHSASCGYKGAVRRKEIEYKRPPKIDLDSEISRSGQAFLHKRGIDLETAEGLGITTKGSWIQFNYFRHGERVNVKSRGLDEKRFKQFPEAEKILYNADSCIGKEKAILVEGEMDVLTWVQALGGLNNEYGVVSLDQGAASPGQSIDGKIECIKNSAPETIDVREWFLCLDQDDPGQWTQEQIIEYLGHAHVKIVTLPKKDANEVLTSAMEVGQDKEVAYQGLRESLASARSVPVPGIQYGNDATLEAIKRAYKHGWENGSTTHFKGLDEHFTYLKGDITLWTGVPNHGKSTWVCGLMLLKSIHDGWKWAIYAPEDSPLEMYIAQAMYAYTGAPYVFNPKYPDMKLAPEDSIEFAHKFISDHFYFIDPPTGTQLPTNEWINTRIEYLVRTEGVNAYLKDPWNKIHHKFDGREDQYLALELSKEKLFARPFDAAFYVAHPTKLQSGKDGKVKVPDAYDISGGAMFNNMFDNIIAVHQPYRGDDTDKRETVHIHVHKIKKQHQVGRPGLFSCGYSWHQNRFYTMDITGVKTSVPLASAEEDSFKDLDKELPF